MKSTTKLRAWLQLFRVPNLFTVPGDPIVGFLFAASGSLAGARMVGACVASLLMYAAGLLVNDLVDIHEDARDRPERPLPSNKVPRRHVLTVACIFFAAALAICLLLSRFTVLVGFALLCAILLYNLELKKYADVGALNMGFCRGLSVLLGAAAAGTGRTLSEPVLGVSAAIMFFIAAVTYLARSETNPRDVGLERWLPAVALALAFLVLTLLMPTRSPLEWFGFAGGFFLAILTALIVGTVYSMVVVESVGSDDTLSKLVPSLVGLLISSLLFIQAGLAMLAGWGRVSAWFALGLLVLWPLSRFTARRFYGS